MADKRPTTLMNVRTFLRGGYALTDEPVTVISRADVVGAWYPAGWTGATVTPMSKASEPPAAVAEVDEPPIGKGLGEIQAVGPITGHQTQDELDAARAARNKALDDARKAKQKQQAEWSRKALRGGGA